jgi:hypothetical protein
MAAANLPRPDGHKLLEKLMSVLCKIKIAAHGACCGTYCLFVTGYHSPALYLIVALAYAAIMLAELYR